MFQTTSTPRGTSRLPFLIGNSDSKPANSSGGEFQVPGTPPSVKLARQNNTTMTFPGSATPRTPQEYNRSATPNNMDGSYIDGKANGESFTVKREGQNGLDYVDASDENQPIDLTMSPEDDYQPINLSTKPQEYKPESKIAKLVKYGRRSPKSSNQSPRKPYQSQQNHTGSPARATTPPQAGPRTPSAAQGAPGQPRSSLKSPGYRKTPIAVAFAEAEAKGEIKSPAKERNPFDAEFARVNRQSPAARVIDSESRNERSPGKIGSTGKSPAKPTDDGVDPTFKPTPGPIYMPKTPDCYPPIRSTELRSSEKKPQSPRPTIPRRSQSYVESAAAAECSPCKSDISSLRGSASTLASPAIDFRGDAYPEAERPSLNVKQIAQKLIDAVQAPFVSPSKQKVDVYAVTDGKSHEEREAEKKEQEKYESTLRLEVSSPRVLQRSVSVVEVTTSPVKPSPTKPVQTRSPRGNLVDRFAGGDNLVSSPQRSRSGKKEKRNEEIDKENENIISSPQRSRSGKKESENKKSSQKKPQFNFTFSEPLSVDVNVSLSSAGSMESVEEEMIVKTQASDANNSLVKSFETETVSNTDKIREPLTSLNNSMLTGTSTVRTPY